MPTKQQIEDILKNIPDPEIGVSLWDLGLIYNIGIDEKEDVGRGTGGAGIACGRGSLSGDKRDHSESGGVDVRILLRPVFNDDEFSRPWIEA